MDKLLHSLALQCTSNTYNRKRPDCLRSDSPAADSPHNSEAFIEIPLKPREKKNELSSSYNNPRVRLPQKTGTAVCLSSVGKPVSLLLSHGEGPRTGGNLSLSPFIHGSSTINRVHSPIEPLILYRNTD